MDDFTRRQVGQDVALVLNKGSFCVLLDMACGGVERLRTVENNVNNMQEVVVVDMVNVAMVIRNKATTSSDEIVQ